MSQTAIVSLDGKKYVVVINNAEMSDVGSSENNPFENVGEGGSVGGLGSDNASASVDILPPAPATTGLGGESATADITPPPATSGDNNPSFVGGYYKKSNKKYAKKQAKVKRMTKKNKRNNKKRMHKV